MERFFFLLPLVPGVLLIFTLVTQLLPKAPLHLLFGHGPALDALIGALVGSLAMGQVFVGYLAGGELVRSGISVASATALMISWATVGLSFLPFEIRAYGLRFALARNLLAFLSTLIIASFMGQLVGWR